jgi:outer membrane protein
MAALQRQQVRLQAIVQAVAAHAEVLTARKLEQRFQLLATALAETERQARLRFSSGDIASTELAQARARRAEADASLAQAQGRRIAGEAAYQRLTGQPAGDLAALPGLPAVPASLDQALSAARATNPALLQAQAATRVARAGLLSARADGLPQVGAFAEATHVADQFFPGYKADSVAVGLRGRWTVFSGGRDGAKVRAARADAGASDARLRQAEQALDGMVIDAWQGLKAGQQVLAASTLRSEAAAEALRGRRLEAKVGAVPTLAVLDAEREAVEAEAARLEAEGAQQVMAWRLDALTGTLPDLPAR